MPFFAASAAATPPETDSPFVVQVDVRFDAWDRDRDGTLTLAEVNAAVSDPAVAGPEAAAIAAIKRATKSKKFPLPPLTRDALTALAAGGPKREKGDDPPPGVNEPATDRAGRPDLNGMYAAALSRITHTGGRRAALFSSAAPSLAGLRQGKLGDCFCLAPLGALLARDPGEVVRRFARRDDGAFAVTLGARTVSAAAPTDAEMALGAAAGRGEMWVNVYEKAVGTIRREELKAAADALVLDVASRGGSAGTMLSVLTGNAMVRFSCAWAKSDKTTPEEREAKLAELRALLTAAQREKRLMTCGTLRTTTPGITPNHAYAVLGYDAATDSARLWNPHGTDFSPKGPAGLEHGYPRKAGVFSIPLADLVKQFSGLAFEQSAPAPAAAPPAAEIAAAP